jgi:hypothetical protein
MAVSRDPLPYRIHTNRELGMMLRGEKPLAVFYDGVGAFPAAMLRYLRMFDRHTAAGRFVKREYVVPNQHVRGTHSILYALVDEAWRIDAMIELRLAMHEGWSAEMERREGELLGYSDWQNDAWISRFVSR